MGARGAEERTAIRPLGKRATGRVWMAAAASATVTANQWAFQRAGQEEAGGGSSR